MHRRTSSPRSMNHLPNSGLIILTCISSTGALFGLSEIRWLSEGRPLARKNGQPYDKELTHNPYPTWQKLEEMVEKGKVRNIGVSKCVSRPNGIFHETDKIFSFNIRRYYPLLLSW